MIALILSLFAAFRRFFGKFSVDESSLAAEQLEPRILYSAAPVAAPVPEAAEEAPVQEAPAAASPAPVQEVTPPAAAPVAVQAVDPETPVAFGEGEVAVEQGVTLVDVDDAAASLNQETVETLAAEARQRWIDSGISAEQIAALDSVSYDVADVGGAHLGVANGFSITIDDDAGGTGVGNWFIDSTPGDDLEFGGGVSAANGRYDLLSTLIHEQGHVLGLDDLYGQRVNVMDGLLDSGTRRLPVDGQADGAVAGSMSGDNFLTANIVRASTSSGGVQANDDSSTPSISADGRYVVFESDATNLVTGDTNGISDVFLRDNASGDVTRVSTDSTGQQAIGGFYGSSDASISNDGRYVLFSSDSSNLVAGDTNGRKDLFLKDLQTDELTRVSTDSMGLQGNGGSLSGTISANNRYVAFISGSSNLVDGDTNNYLDAFVKDLKTGVVKLVSTSESGQQGDGASLRAEISDDGRFVAFSSNAEDLVPDDTNGVVDAFVKNWRTGKLTRVTTNSNGEQGTGGSLVKLSISANGRYVAFESAASGLVSGASNGLPDIFVKDTKTGITTWVSTDVAGDAVGGLNLNPSISADGRYVAFSSTSSDLVVGDTNADADIFIKDLETGAVTRVSTDVTGGQSSDWSLFPALSADGRFVVFESDAADLVSGDSNGKRDIFVKGVSAVTSGSPYTTSVEIDAFGNLVIEDIDGQDTDDKLFIGIVDGRLEIRDAKSTVGSSIVGSALVGTKGRGVSVDLSSFTGDIVVKTGGGKDRVTFGDLHDLPAGVESYDENPDERIDVRGDISLTGSSGIVLGGQQIVFYKGSSLTTASGTIDLYAGTETQRGRVTGISANGAALTTGSGNIFISGAGGRVGGGNRGVFLKNTDITSAGGSVTISSEAKSSGSSNTGVHLGKGTDIVLGGAGNLLIYGRVIEGKNGNRGLRIDSGVTLQTNNGDLTLRGVVQDAVSSNTAVQIGKAAVSVVGFSGGDLRVSGQVSLNVGSRDVAVKLKGTSIESLNSGGSVTIDYMGNTSTEGRGNRGVVMSSARITSKAGDIAIIKNPDIAGSSGFGNTGVRAVKTDIESRYGGLTIRGFHDEARTGNGNRGFHFSGGSIGARGAIDIQAKGGGGGSGNTAMQITSSTIGGASTVLMIADAATTTTGGNNRGIDLKNVTVQGLSEIELIGNGGTGSSSNEGVRIRGGSIKSAFSSIEITGDANPTLAIDTAKTNNIGLNLSKTVINGITEVSLTGVSGSGTNGNSGIKMRDVTVKSQITTVLIRGFAFLANDATGKSNQGLDARNVEINAPGDVTIEGRGGAGTNRNVGTSINGGTVTSVSGDIVITGLADSVTTGAGNGGVILKNVDVTAGSNLSITATGGGGTHRNTAIGIRGGSVTALNGDLTIAGNAQMGTTGSYNHGAEILGSTINSTNSDMSIEGTGGGGINQNMGVRIVGGSMVARNGTGVISMVGAARSGTLGSWNVGVYIFNKVTIDGSFEVDGAGGGGTKLNHGIYMHKRITAVINSLNGTAGAGDDSEDEAGNFFP